MIDYIARPIISKQHISQKFKLSCSSNSLGFRNQLGFLRFFKSIQFYQYESRIVFFLLYIFTSFVCGLHLDARVIPIIWIWSYQRSEIVSCFFVLLCEWYSLQSIRNTWTRFLKYADFLGEILNLPSNIAFFDSLKYWHMSILTWVEKKFYSGVVKFQGCQKKTHFLYNRLQIHR